jgi:hypothetical protein
MVVSVCGDDGPMDGGANSSWTRPDPLMIVVALFPINLYGGEELSSAMND